MQFTLTLSIRPGRVTTSRKNLGSQIRGIRLARMDRLEAADKEALQVASIFGQRFPLVTLRTLLANPAYDPSGLVLHYLVRPHGEELLFSHALIRDAAYATLLRSPRLARYWCRELSKTWWLAPVCALQIAAANLSKVSPASGTSMPWNGDA
jgi:hypothetical protein